MTRLLTILSIFIWIVISATAQVLVSNITDLKNEIEGATGNLEIEITGNLQESSVVPIDIIIPHTFQVKINGGGNTIDNILLSITPHTSNLSSITVDIEDIKFSGGGLVLGENGVYTLNKTNFTDVTDNVALLINNKADVTISDSYFARNSNGAIFNRKGILHISKSTLENNINNFPTKATGGGAGGIVSYAGLYVDQCTFAENINKSLQVSLWDSASSGGAISYYGGSVNSRDFKIINSVFLNNVGYMQGGAIGAAMPEGAPVAPEIVLEIDNCYFKGNNVGTHTTTDDGKRDGGAIAIYSNWPDVTMKVTNSTFESNWAYDDAGALYATKLNAGSNFSEVKNCTFYGNYCKNTSGLSYGGCIEVADNIQMNIENCTFTANYNEYRIIAAGAIGAYNAHKVTFKIRNNIFLGNKRNSSGWIEKNIYPGSNANTLVENNIGEDHIGTIPAKMTLENVFGTSTPTLQKNFNSPKIGNPNETNTDYYLNIPTIPIKPYDPNDYPIGSTEEWSTLNYSADAKSSTTATTDQRGFLRGTPADIGAVDILWAKFDAYIDGTDDGYWENLADLVYDGTEYYEKDGNNQTTSYFIISHMDGTIKNAPSTPIHPEGMVFAGWMELDENGNEIDLWNGQSITMSDNKRFRATWKEKTTPPVPPVPPIPDPEPEPEPKPDPDPDPALWLMLRPIADLCYFEQEFRIPFDLNEKSLQLEYSISFSQEAKDAGFTDITEYIILPESGYISVTVLSPIPQGKYSGTVYVRVKDSTSSVLGSYPFSLQVMDIVRIKSQPVSAVNKCEGDGFVLQVEATGETLTYQWYHNDKKIEGAISNQHFAILNTETEGNYYAIISGSCGQEVSDKVTVKFNQIKIETKWNDILYIKNIDNKYTKYQWYKNGEAITAHGNSIYYTDTNGLLGTYHVRAYYDNENYTESCSITFSEKTRSSAVSVYPNPVLRSEQLVIESNELGESYVGALIEIFDLAGRKIYSTQAISSKTTIPMTTPTGVYIVNITGLSGKRTIQKIVVK